jgi:hypothetical protein
MSRLYRLNISKPPRGAMPSLKKAATAIAIGLVNAVIALLPSRSKPRSGWGRAVPALDTAGETGFARPVATSRQREPERWISSTPPTE